MLVIALIIWLLGGNPLAFLNMAQRQGQQGPPGQMQQGPDQEGPEEKERREFIQVVLADTEDVWGQLFANNGHRYQAPTLVLFREGVQSGCGMASSSTGPFYCPADQKVYLDLGFFDELADRFGAKGDFARAYVVAHEIGHHVQFLLGTSEKVQAAQQQVDEREARQLSVMLELQADFYAGVWAHHAQKMKNILEPGDIEEALNCASQIGDDRIQKQARGYVQPDSFTHGSAAQRAKWFKKGFETGDMRQGNTFDSPDL
jgi:predicted metalloprotease